MGIVDIEALMEINEQVKKLHTKYSFKVDHGSFETAIEFWQMGYHHPPKSRNWEESRANGNEIKCPDLLDYHNKSIIEFEEEPKPGKRGGKLGRKGHVEESDRDEHRDMLYRIAGFRFLKFWETDLKEKNWDKLYNFLLNNKKM